MVPLVRRAVRLHPQLADTVLALVMTVLTVKQAMGANPVGWRHFDLLGVALSGAANLPLALRRLAPMTVLLVAVTAAATYQLAGYWPVVNALGVQLAVFTVASMRSYRMVAVSLALVLPVILHAALITWPYSNSPWDIVAQNLVWYAVIVAIGDGARRLTERGRRLAELSEQLRHEQEDKARRAVTDERVRIARELHDVVAHHMSVISVQAGLARYVFESDPATASAALGTIADTGREALDEMRRLLAVLRLEREPDEQGATSYDPTPGLSQLGDLLDRMRGAGMPVELVTAGAERSLAPGLDLCAYRVIQESLTNVLKHTDAASVTVTLHYHAHELVVRIRDDGAGAGSKPDGKGSGQGVIGMRERARLYGGTLIAGPRPDGGFDVVLMLPTTTPATEVR
ncbi:sensor histidine kinase [Solihabitans fulvus]|nr:sensor histidine kinase [Solihabitans fulvus]